MLESQNNYPAQTITTRQKLAVAFLLIFVMSMIGLAAYGMKKNLTESLAYSGEQGKLSDLDQTATSSDEYLKDRDTDKDTLSDYDEIKVYGTSAFLPDTDGDGIYDALELKNGTNPLCPEGKDCNNQGALFNANAGVSASSSDMANTGQQPVFTAEQLKQMEEVGGLADLKSELDKLPSTGSGQATSTGSLGQVGQVDTSAGAGLSASEKAQAQAILQGGASAANLREALLKSGIPQAQLDQITDEALLKNYQDMLGKKTQ